MNTKDMMRRIVIAIMSSALILLLVMCGSAEKRVTFTYPQDSEETQSTEPQSDDEADSEDDAADSDPDEDSDAEEDSDEEEDEDVQKDSDTEEDGINEVDQGANAIMKRYARLMEALASSNAEDAEDEDAEEAVEASNEMDADEGLTDEEYVELEKTCNRVQEIYNAIFGGDRYVTNQDYRARVAPYEDELDELESRMLELSAKAGWKISADDDDFDNDDSDDIREYEDYD